MVELGVWRKAECVESMKWAENGNRLSSALCDDSDVRKVEQVAPINRFLFLPFFFLDTWPVDIQFRVLEIINVITFGAEPLVF
jgi:hypothetical protein